jgi:hypothetical protein
MCKSSRQHQHHKSEQLNMIYHIADWQHPFVNVFKLCDVQQSKNVEVSGRVVQQMVGMGGFLLHV